jgi:hypothetical protein
MKTNLIKSFIILTSLILAAGCVSPKHTENILIAAGFKLVAAETPQQEQKLKSLPTDKITLTHRNGKTYYVFPDPVHDRIYLGTPKEYQNYQQILLDNQIADQNRVNAEMGQADGSDWESWPDWEIMSW